MQDGINPILNDNDYPEMGVRLGIDVGENVVVQYGWSTNSYSLMGENHDNETDSHNDKDTQYYIDNKEVGRSITDNSVTIKTNRMIRKPHLDVLIVYFFEIHKIIEPVHMLLRSYVFLCAIQPDSL